MKNNTKVRLHLSKQLFESLTKEIIKEAKANDGYTVAVKQPKTPKQSKSQANSPEVQKTDKEKTEGLSPDNIGPGGVVVDDSNWHQNGKNEAPGVPPVPGKSAVDKLNLAGANMEIKDAKTFAKAILDIAQKLQSKEGFKPESNPNIKRAMDALRTLSSGAPAMPQVPTNKSTNSAPKAPPVPPLPGKKEEVKEANDFSNHYDYTYRLVDGNCIRINPETQERAKVHHTYCNNLKKEMQTNVAEEGQMNEMVDVSWEAVAAGMAAMGLAPLAIDKMHQWWKKKYPKSFEKAQALSGAIDRQASGNTPGQGHGVDTSKTFGPQNEKNALKEYENDDYRVVNGECRRYNDEHEYVVVSMSNCR